MRASLDAHQGERDVAVGRQHRDDDIALAHRLSQGLGGEGPDVGLARGHRLAGLPDRAVPDHHAAAGIDQTAQPGA